MIGFQQRIRWFCLWHMLGQYLVERGIVSPFYMVGMMVALKVSVCAEQIRRIEKHADRFEGRGYIPKGAGSVLIMDPQCSILPSAAVKRLRDRNDLCGDHGLSPAPTVIAVQKFPKPH